MVRIKNRYLLLNILYPAPRDKTKLSDQPSVVQIHQPSSSKLEPHVLLRAIRESVVHLFGDYGAGMVSSSLSVKYLSPATSTAIVRVSRAHYRLVWAALTFITRLPNPVNEACTIRVVRVSGTIRKAEEEAVRRARASILKARRQAEEMQMGEGGIGGAPTPLELGALESIAQGDEERGEVVERGIESDVSDEGGSEDDEDG